MGRAFQELLGPHRFTTAPGAESIQVAKANLLSLLAATLAASAFSPAEAQELAPENQPVASQPVTMAAAPAGQLYKDRARATYGPPVPDNLSASVGEVRWDIPPETLPQALVEAIKLATSRDPSIVATASSVRAAAAEVRGAKWLRFPSLTAQASYATTNSRLTGTNFNPGLTVDLPVWTGGRISNTVKRAKAEELSAYGGWLESILGLSLTVSNTYFSIVSASRREAILEESLTAHRQLVGTMERRVDQQVSPRADLELAKSRAAQVEQELTVARAQRLTALGVLKQLIREPAYDIGRDPGFDNRLYSELWPTVSDEMVAYSPTILKLTGQAQAAQAQVSVSKASILPQLNLQYSYSEVLRSRVGVSLLMQTDGGLSKFSAVDASRSRYEATLAQIATTERELRQQASTDVIEYGSMLSKALVSRTASSTAEAVSESYMRQFIAGRKSWLDVMNSLREFVSARISLSEAEVSVMATNSRLLLRSGRWQPVVDSGN